MMLKKNCTGLIHIGHKLVLDLIFIPHFHFEVV